jgi:hypothetical protein
VAQIDALAADRLPGARGQVGRVGRLQTAAELRVDLDDAEVAHADGDGVGWQGNVPLVVMEDAAGARRTYTPTASLLGSDGVTWAAIKVPLTGGAGWQVSGDSVDLAHVAAIEIHVDTWDAGFTRDLDGMGFEKATTVCACPVTLLKARALPVTACWKKPRFAVACPAMCKRSLLVCLFLVVATFACKKNEPGKTAAEAMTRKPAAPSPGAMAMRPPQPKPEEVKGLLTEEKITSFLTYQKEIAAVTSEAMGMGMSAVAKVGTDQKKLEKEVTKDDRYAKIAAASKTALAKSGLTQDEMVKLTQVLSPYYARVYATAHFLRNNPPTAGAEPPKPGSMEAARLKSQEQRMAGLETSRKEFGERYGAAALELVKKHEPEFVEINKKMMAAAFGAMADKNKMPTPAR